MEAALIEAFDGDKVRAAVEIAGFQHLSAAGASALLSLAQSTAALTGEAREANKSLRYLSVGIAAGAVLLGVAQVISALRQHQSGAGARR